MNIDTQTMDAPALAGVHPQRLFFASCMSLISTAVAFGVVTGFLGQLKAHFGLDNAQVGWIGGAAIWGFTISIFILGPLCDALGMKFLMRFAFVCHAIGVLVMILATGFTALFIGALIIAMGNGTVEAACNPLVATLFPNDKTKKLNQFHMWFPGGIVIGGLFSFAVDHMIADVGHNWQIKIALVLLPTVIYGILFIGQKFPATERVQSGLSFGQMVAATFGRPLFIILFFCMMITASLELGPGRWMGEAMEGAIKAVTGMGEAGILVLVYGSVLMCVLRGLAGPVVHKLSNTGLLTLSAILGGSGLYLLTVVHSAGAIIAAATIFYVGVCYFWPTMIGTAAERIPKGGALALAILGGTGMAVVGLITVPLMGAIADHYVKTDLASSQTTTVLTQIATDYRAMEVTATTEDAKRDLHDAANSADAAVKSSNADDASAALRTAIKVAPDSPAGKQAAEIIQPADEHGTVMSFRWVAASSIVLVLVFGILYMMDLSKGGYRAERLTADAAH
ncbi:MAG TPA: MFS transporter [Tepidisphaeraceae bacterium]|jgi:MFS family permease|nr:MFS transporter [Tepidisphaeraceae bacterium]